MRLKEDAIAEREREEKKIAEKAEEKAYAGDNYGDFDDTFASTSYDNKAGSGSNAVDTNTYGEPTQYADSGSYNTYNTRDTYSTHDTYNEYNRQMPDKESESNTFEVIGDGIQRGANVVAVFAMVIVLVFSNGLFFVLIKHLGTKSKFFREHASEYTDCVGKVTVKDVQEHVTKDSDGRTQKEYKTTFDLAFEYQGNPYTLQNLVQTSSSKMSDGQRLNIVVRDTAVANRFQDKNDFAYGTLAELQSNVSNGAVYVLIFSSVWDILLFYSMVRTITGKNNRRRTVRRGVRIR